MQVLLTQQEWEDLNKKIKDLEQQLENIFVSQGDVLLKTFNHARYSGLESVYIRVKKDDPILKSIIHKSKIVE